MDFKLVGGGRAANQFDDVEAAKRALREGNTLLALKVQQGGNDVRDRMVPLVSALLSASPNRAKTNPQGATQVRISNGIVGIQGINAGSVEFGGWVWQVFGKSVQQGTMRRPITQQFTGGRAGPPDQGYVLGAAWKVYREKADELMADEGLEAYSESLDKNGVRRAYG